MWAFIGHLPVGRGFQHQVFFGVNIESKVRWSRCCEFCGKIDRLLKSEPFLAHLQDPHVPVPKRFLDRAFVQFFDLGAEGREKSGVGVCGFNGFPMHPPPVFPEADADLLDMPASAAVQRNDQFLNALSRLYSTAVPIGLLLQMFLRLQGQRAIAHPKSEPFHRRPIGCGQNEG